MNYERASGFHADDDDISSPRGSARPWQTRIPWLFVIMVAIPSLLTTLYYLAIAAPLYVSEAHFVVRAHGQQAPVGLGSILQSVGVSGGGSATDAFEVQAYMVSRDAVMTLAKRDGLRTVMNRPEADFLMRFPRPFEGQSFENLFESYKRYVTVGYDSQTGISTLRVTAFRADDAQRIANALLDDGETLINRLNDRSMADAVSQAQRQVLDAETRGAAAQTELTSFRNRERLIDPDRSSLAGIDLLSKLQLQVATLRAERAGLAASAPESPQISVLDKQITAYNAQLEAERTRTAGENDSLAPKVGEYERLTLERDIAVKSLEVAVATLESARVEERKKQQYLERIVAPNAPDKATEPKRLLSILRIVVGCLVAYSTIALFAAGLREHNQR